MAQAEAAELIVVEVVAKQPDRLAEEEIASKGDSKWGRKK